MVGNASPRLEYWFLPVDNLERSTGQPFSNIACKAGRIRPFLMYTFFKNTLLVKRLAYVKDGV
jgi:hypothetical protein